MPPSVRIASEVEAALRERRPIVALESSVLAQGLPIPQNRSAAERMSAAVRAAGAVPAITAVVRGVPTLGLAADELERFLARDGVRKVSARDVPIAVAKQWDGATTVAASLAIASAANAVLAGASRAPHPTALVFATGGIGGVHRDAPYDESADLMELARTPMIVVCAGAKAILDLRATWERLESLGVPVIGYGTDELPGFFTGETGISLGARADDIAEIVATFRAHRALGRTQSLVVVQPPPKAFAMDRSRVEAAVERAQADARRDGVLGAAVTPYLLAAVSRLTDGSSLDANLALLERNAATAGAIATMCSREWTEVPPSRY